MVLFRFYFHPAGFISTGDLKDRHDLESAQIHESELPKQQRILFPSIHRICILSAAGSLNINLATMISRILLYKTRDRKGTQRNMQMMSVSSAFVPQSYLTLSNQQFHSSPQPSLESNLPYVFNRRDSRWLLLTLDKRAGASICLLVQRIQTICSSKSRNWVERMVSESQIQDSGIQRRKKKQIC